MTHNHFTYGELLKFGWEKTKQHLWFLVGVTFFYFLISFITNNIPVVRDIVSMLMGIALIALSFVIVDGHTPHCRNLLAPFKDYKITWHYFLTMVLSVIIVIIGLIALILPGIYLAVRLQFALYFIVENENTKPIEALKKSMAITKGMFWKLFGFLLVFILINIAGALLLGVGLFITLPVTTIAYTHLYKKLSSHAHHHEGAHIA